MTTTLGDIKRNNNISSYNNVQNTVDVNAIILEIKQDIIEINKHFNEYTRKTDEAAREYKKVIAITMAKLTKLTS